MAELIGLCRCPACGSVKARLSLSSKNLPVLTCNACNMQAFARSDTSDMHFRSWLVKSPPVQSEAEPKPVQDLAPKHVQEAQPTQPTTPAEKTKKSGLLSGTFLD